MMPHDPDRAEQAYMSGLQLGRAGDLEGSLREFQRSTEYQPEDDSARVAGNLVRDAINGVISQQALIHFLNGAELAQRRSLSAITEILAGTQLEPRYAPGFGALAFVYMMNNNFREAERCFRQALELAPDAAERAHGLGRFYQNMRKPGLATKYYRRALEIDPAFPPTLRYFRTLRDEGLDQLPPEPEPVFAGTNAAAGSGCFGIITVSLAILAIAIHLWVVN